MPPKKLNPSTTCFRSRYAAGMVEVASSLQDKRMRHLLGKKSARFALNTGMSGQKNSFILSLSMAYSNSCHYHQQLRCWCSWQPSQRCEIPPHRNPQYLLSRLENRQSCPAGASHIKYWKCDRHYRGGSGRPFVCEEDLHREDSCC